MAAAAKLLLSFFSFFISSCSFRCSCMSLSCLSKRPQKASASRPLCQCCFGVITLYTTFMVSCGCCCCNSFPWRLAYLDSLAELLYFFLQLEVVFCKFVVGIKQTKESIRLSASVPPLFRSNCFVVSIHGQLRLLLFLFLASWLCLISSALITASSSLRQGSDSISMSLGVSIGKVTLDSCPSTIRVSIQMS